jgi:hypothetical protein
MPTHAGLICGHTNCDALFSDIEDSVAHANDCHAGTYVVNTCGVREVINASGQVELLLVLNEPEKDGE